MRPGYVDARLADRVVSIDVVDSDGGEAAILPSTSAVLGIQVHGRVRAGDQPLATAGITGLQPTARVYGYARPTRSVLVRFTPQGARCLGVPASELASRSVALAELVAPARARDLVEQVAEAPTAERAIAAVAVFVLERSLARDPLIDQAIVRIDRALDRASADDAGQIAELARALGIGERQLERRFHDRIGLSPKRFASLRRFERAIQLASRAPSLTDAAIAAGYYDQSHFIRDFRRFAGVTPGEWLRRTMSGSSKR